MLLILLHSRFVNHDRASESFVLENDLETTRGVPAGYSFVNREERPADSNAVGACSLCGWKVSHWADPPRVWRNVIFWSRFYSSRHPL